MVVDGDGDDDDDDGDGDDDDDGDALRSKYSTTYCTILRNLLRAHGCGCAGEWAEEEDEGKTTFNNSLTGDTADSNKKVSATISLVGKNKKPLSPPDGCACVCACCC